MKRPFEILVVVMTIVVQLNALDSCPEVTCPDGCERETGAQQHRCPWCVCHPIAARKTLEKFEQRHCPKELVEFVKTQSGHLKEHVFKLSDAVRQQKVLLKNFGKLHVPQIPTTGRKQCPTPTCNTNCTLVTGDHGCPDCECPPTHCPRKKCPPGCHRETGILHDRCPECVCEAEMQVVHALQCATPLCAPNCTLVTGDHGCPDCECPPTHCPRKKCPPGCHRETGILHDRCPECVCEAEMQRVHPLQCATPMCAPNCTLVTGDHGCPDCECPPTHCPRKRCPQNCHRETRVTGNRCPECVCDGDAGAEVTPSELHGRPKRDEDDSSEESSEEKTGTTQTRQKRDTPKRKGDDSSEESSEESSEDNHVHKERSRDSSEEIRTRPLRTYRSKRHHHFGALRKKHNTSVHHQPGQVQCTPPVCEAYCTTKPGPHGCLACDCPDVCPEIVCGDGCHPEYTEHRKCERCVCNPQSERQTMADVFYSHCGEGSLRTLLIDFVNLKKTLEILERQLKEHDEEISKIEDRHGITEPVSSDHAHDHASLHHHGQHHGHHGQHHGHHGNPLGDHHHDHHRGHH